MITFFHIRLFLRNEYKNTSRIMITFSAIYITQNCICRKGFRTSQDIIILCKYIHLKKQMTTSFIVLINYIEVWSILRFFFIKFEWIYTFLYMTCYIKKTYHVLPCPSLFPHTLKEPSCLRQRSSLSIPWKSMYFVLPEMKSY